MKQYDVAVYIGRFQPACKHHIKTIEFGLEIANKLVVVVGSAKRPRDTDNPFTAEERIAFLKSALSPEQLEHINFVPKVDLLYDNEQWIAGVEYHVNKESDNWDFQAPRVVLIGSKSDESSWYLDRFPYWEKRLLEISKATDGSDLHASQLRNILFTQTEWSQDEALSSYCTPGVYHAIREFRENNPEVWEYLRGEQEFYINYWKQFEGYPYGRPISVTTDAVVTQSSNVLMVRRKSFPGKGLWALPGGFLNPDEALFDGMLRELSEETRIQIPYNKLVNSVQIAKTQVFDHPKRSKRGRIITHAYRIPLNEPQGMLPRIKGADDAEKAKWIPFSELVDMRDQIFEDHYDIIRHMVGGFM